MRKFLIPLLLASVAATPALADPNDNQQNNRQQAHEQRAQARDESRGDRGGNRPAWAGAQRDQFQGAQTRDMAQRPQFNEGGGRVQPQFEGRREGFGGQAGFEQQRQALARQQQQEAYAEQRQQGDRNGAWRQGQRNWQGQAYRGERNWQGQSYQGQSYQGQRYNQRYQGQQYMQQRVRNDGNRMQAMNWDRRWRDNNRYDWRRYRDRHRSTFHLGLYIDPFGLGYQSFGIGYQMYPAYYGNQYWIDPAMYDLPFPPPGAAWVRYWNDALLVDTYTGTVIDAIPGFFW